jgi:hypothetical protein
MIHNKWLLLGVFGVALVINPYLACSSSSEDEFKYSESEMKSAVLGEWEGTASLNGESVAFSLTLEQASNESKTQSAPRVSPQCGSRSFVKPAAACVSMSEMPLTGTITSENPDLNGAVEGGAHAYLNLDPTDIDLVLESGLTLHGSIKSDALKDGRISTREGDAGTFSLSRP